MKNRIRVEIGGDTYTIVAEDDEAYIKKTAELVDDKIREISQNSRLSALASAVLAAVNFADDYQKALSTADNMRDQMKSYLDDVSRLKNELNELRRESNRTKGAK